MAFSEELRSGSSLGSPSALIVSNMELLCTDGRLANSSFVSLSLRGSTLGPGVLSLMTKNEALRDLRLKDVDCLREDDLHALTCLPRLEILEMDCPPLTPLPLGDLLNLKRVTLGVRKVTEKDVQMLNSCKGEVCLNVHCGGVRSGLAFLPLVKKLVGLKLKSFGTSTFPVIVHQMPGLTSLSFEDGRLAATDKDFNPFMEKKPVFPDLPLLPDAVRCLQISCNVDSAVINNFVKHGSHLTQFVWRTHCISGLADLKNCSNLKVLELSAEELDGTVFETVASLKELEILHFGGCLDLTIAQTKFLTNLSSLKQLKIACTDIRGLGLEVIDVFENLMSLKSLHLVHSEATEKQVAALMGSPLISKLTELSVGKN